MEKDTKIVIGAVLLLMFTMSSFSFIDLTNDDDSISGNAFRLSRISQNRQQTTPARPDITTCSPPLWNGWKVDACLDENGNANCDKNKQQQAADYWCQQNTCGNKPKALSFKTGWTEGTGTKYAPSGKECTSCSSHFTDIQCGTPTQPTPQDPSAAL